MLKKREQDELHHKSAEPTRIDASHAEDSTRAVRVDEFPVDLCTTPQQRDQLDGALGLFRTNVMALQPAPSSPLASTRAGMDASRPEHDALNSAVVQFRMAVQSRLDDDDAKALALTGMEGQGSDLPYRDHIQRLFGRHDISDVQAHNDDKAQEATAALGAHGYASGERVALTKGADLHTVAHEAAHVIQQRHGHGATGDASLEGHADRVAEAVVTGRSAEPLLDGLASGAGRASVTSVQLKKGPATPKQKAEKELKAAVIARTKVADKDKVRETTITKEWASKALGELAQRKSVQVAWNSHVAALVGASGPKRAKALEAGAKAVIEAIELDFVKDPAASSLDLLGKRKADSYKNRNWSRNSYPGNWKRLVSPETKKEASELRKKRRAARKKLRAAKRKKDKKAVAAATSELKAVEKAIANNKQAQKNDATTKEPSVLKDDKAAKSMARAMNRKTQRERKPNRDKRKESGIMSEGQFQAMKPKDREKTEKFFESRMVSVKGELARLQPEAAKAFVQLRDAAAAEGITVRIKSADRSFAAARASAKGSGNKGAVASWSNHSLGLAVDIFLNEGNAKLHKAATPACAKDKAQWDALGAQKAKLKKEIEAAKKAKDRSKATRLASELKAVNKKRKALGKPNKPRPSRHRKHGDETMTSPMNQVVKKQRKSPVHKWMLVMGHKYGWFPFHNEPWHFEYNPPGYATKLKAELAAHLK